MVKECLFRNAGSSQTGLTDFRLSTCMSCHLSRGAPSAGAYIFATEAMHVQQWAQSPAQARLSWCIIWGSDGLPDGDCITIKALTASPLLLWQVEDEESEAAAVPASSGSAAAARRQTSQQQDVRKQLDRLLAKTRERSASTKEADGRLR